MGEPPDASLDSENFVDPTAAGCLTWVMTSLPLAPRVPLRRPRASMATGVSAGLAAHLGWSVAVVRLLFALTSLMLGAGILLYLWLWIFVPLADEPSDAVPSRSAPVAWISIGIACVATLFAGWGMIMGTSGLTYAGSPEWVALTAIAQVSCVIAGLWAGFLDVQDPLRGPRHVVAVRASATGILLALIVMYGLLIVMYGFDFAVRGSSVLVFITALCAVIALAAVYAPALVISLRGATHERIRRIREEQRSEMAAHLHDSVLQTLALIQNRAGASSEAARLARAQERELRSWLYDGDDPADSDLPTDLRDYAAALELDYPVVIDVVAAGASTERASGEVAAAAREAILNAARHAPGPISVYIEGSERAVDVFVRDRGGGFDLAAVPSDRLGVRQSIIGRMRRAGGDARIVRRETGTEIHLTLDYARATQRSQEMS